MTDGLRRSLPNAITLLRLVLAAGFFAALNSYRYPDTNTLWAGLAVGLFIAAAITDALDGYLARRWQVVSTFGRIMDPFCDKVLIMGAFIYLAGPRFVIPERVEADDFFTMITGIYPWMVVVILARELLVTAIRGVVESMGVSFGSKLSGKIKMILQSIVIPIVLIIVLVFDPNDPDNLWAKWVRDVLVYFTVVVTLWSGIPYVTGLRAVLAQRGPPADNEKRPGSDS